MNGSEDGLWQVFPKDTDLLELKEQLRLLSRQWERPPRDAHWAVRMLLDNQWVKLGVPGPARFDKDGWELPPELVEVSITERDPARDAYVLVYEFQRERGTVLVPRRALLKADREALLQWAEEALNGEGEGQE